MKINVQKEKGGEFIIERRIKRWCWEERLRGRKGRETGNCEEVGLTFFGVTWCILAGVANHPIEVPGSVFQHVIPGRHKIHAYKPATCIYNYIIRLH